VNVRDDVLQPEGMYSRRLHEKYHGHIIQRAVEYKKGIMTVKRIVCIFILLFISISVLANVHAPLITASIQQKLTPDDALHRLMIGNERFVENKRQNSDFLKHARLTAKKQHPIAIVLSCIDSRVPPEIIFDQTVGNIFVTRVAANVINKDVLAGMEYATKISGAKLIVVLGHQSCGAIKGACDNVKLGNLTQLLQKIQPAIQDATHSFGKKECDNPHFINTAAEDNVQRVVNLIPEESPVIRQLIQQRRVKIIGAMYHLHSGKVILMHVL